MGQKFDLITGTDQCDCKRDYDAPYPACPHDIRGHEGKEGIAGVFEVMPLIMFKSVL